ncbi:uncharacterized protein A4U43_C10F10780 [Asparagus officinalis]|uniref:Uncharacterized protein n=1 Tax=Asparagus officinalis TaxID=4686 RepID=A0A5P1E569_ASPOF|nr:uncharacterized protein A4U43_C10F10780 [Asparagus officinalis]
MGDYNDPFMRNKDAAVQARTKPQNRANVLQLKLVLYQDPVVGLDTEAQTLTTSSGKLLKYGSLIISTGCESARTLIQYHYAFTLNVN